MESELKTNILILYHFPCLDGVYSCLNVYFYYMENKKKKYNFTFIPIKSNEGVKSRLLFDVALSMDKIFILDRGVTLNDLEYIFLIIKTLNNEKKKIKFFHFDHHVTEENSTKFLESNQDSDEIRSYKSIYRDDKACCGLTLEYFKKKIIYSQSTILNENYNKIIYLVEKADLYHEEKDVFEFKNGLLEYIYPQMENLKFNNSESSTFNLKMNQLKNINIEQCIRRGIPGLKKYKEKALTEVRTHPVKLKIKVNDFEYNFLSCLTDKKHVRNYGCELLININKELGYDSVAAFIYSYDQDSYKVSMRSKNGEAIKIAKFYGGTGHINAASFLMNKNYLSKYKEDIHGIRKKIREIMNGYIL